MDSKLRSIPGGRPLKKLFEAYGAGTYYWSPRAGLSQVLVGISGGGGGGAGGQNGDPCLGGGGGSGSYAEVPMRVVPGRSYKITLGAGGTAGGIGAVGSEGGASHISDANASEYALYLPGGLGGLLSNGVMSLSLFMGGRGGFGGRWSGGNDHERADGEPALIGGGSGGASLYGNSGGVAIGGSGGGGFPGAVGGISGPDNLASGPTAGGYGCGGGGGQGNTGGGAKAGANGGDGAIIIYELPSA
jgi:hypothetical protein